MESVVVAAGILIDAGRVLVTRRRADDHLGGMWEFPGGKVHAGESVEDALVRELREELGVRVLPGPRWGTLSHRYPGRDVLIHFLFVDEIHGVPRAHAAEELRWVTPPEMAPLPFPDADRPLVEDLIRCHREGIPLREAKHPVPGHREESA